MEQNENVNPTPENQPVVDSQPTPGEKADAAVATKEDKTMAMLCHLLAIITFFVGPLIIWLLKKDQSAYVNEQGKEALNFQITVFIAYIVATILTPVACIGFILYPVVWIGNLVFCIMACVAANKGEPYRYPVCLRLIK